MKLADIFEARGNLLRDYSIKAKEIWLNWKTYREIRDEAIKLMGWKFCGEMTYIMGLAVIIDDRVNSFEVRG